MLVREGVRVDEDRLTHAVVGLMRYLPPELWFQPFIRELRRRNPTAQTNLDAFLDPKIELWPSYSIPSSWSHAFWRPRAKKGVPETPKGSICPDAVIYTDKWIMFIESEYSHDVDTEQLFQQFAIASRERNEKEFFLLLINRAITRPSHCGVDSASFNKPEANVCRGDSLEQYITACSNDTLGLQFTEEDVKQRLLWINWQSLYQLFSEMSLNDKKKSVPLPRAFQRMVKNMRQDVCELLEREGLVPIGFDIIDVLAQHNITVNSLPFLPVIKPITWFLKELNINVEAIPKWNGDSA